MLYEFRSQDQGTLGADAYWRAQGWTLFPAQYFYDDLSKDELLELLDELLEELKRLKVAAGETSPSVSV